MKATFTRPAVALAIAGALLATGASTASSGAGEDTDASEATTEATADTTADDTTGDSTAGTGEGDDPEFEITPQSTMPRPDAEPVRGGRLVVAGEAEVGSPWTPAAVQCDSFCYVRIRTFIEPLFVVTPDLSVEGWLAESIEANEDSTVFTVTLRDGISFTDGSAFTSAVAVDNLNRTFTSALVQGAMRDVAKNPDGSIVAEIVDDLTFTISTGKNGDLTDPVSWYQFPYFLTAQPGLMASSEWLAAVDADPNLASQAVGTGPFIIEEYSPADRLTVTRNPDYWRSDEAGNQLPYLDEIEFRVITDSQVRAQALEAGDVDMIATSDPNVVGRFVDDDRFVTALQTQRTETNYVMLHLTQPQFQDREVRCALIQAIDKDAFIDVIAGGFAESANGPFSPGQDGYLEDNGLPEYDPDAARAAIEAWEAENGPLAFTFSTPPTGTNKATADFLQQAWGEIGVDLTQNTLEQSQFITAAALGAPEYFAFGWRQHSGQWADTQNHWWHGFGADAAGSEVADGALNLNFGRLNDPVINDLLDQARETAGFDERVELAQEINRQFGRECWILPLTYTNWGLIASPRVQNLGYDPVPGGGAYALDGAGTFWTASLFLAEE